PRSQGWGGFGAVRGPAAARRPSPRPPAAMDLGEVHQAQLSRFGAFFRAKRDEVIAERDSEKNEFLRDQIADPSAIFNAADVQQILEGYHMQVMMHTREDLDRFASLSGVYVSFLMAQAESSGMVLQVDDVSASEDQSRIHQVEELAALNAPPLAPKPRGQLTALPGAGGADLAVLQELQELRERGRQLEDYNLKLQGDLDVSSQRCAELEQVKANMQQHLLHSAEGAGGMSSAQAEQYERALGEARAECEMLRIGDMDQKLNDSSQVRDLKALLKKKNDDIKGLRQVVAQAGLQPGGGDGTELDTDSD
ncbi:unnamed protein product, partial [Prorocentrum cordatum]